ncbi:hypothetical protein RTBOTA2_006521 [Rhodotorula toruloides]|nr:hypothetical protein RTBOTA2_006521 [Rhodotorula toruloides]
MDIVSRRASCSTRRLRRTVSPQHEAQNATAANISALLTLSPPSSSDATTHHLPSPSQLRPPSSPPYK